YPTGYRVRQRTRDGATEPLKRGPFAGQQSFNRFERRLVSHLRAFPYPVAEIEIRQSEVEAALNLPEDAVRPVTRRGRLGIEERIHGRQAIAQSIDETDDSQLVLVAKFIKVCRDVAVQQEVLVLLTTVLIHPATGVAQSLVPQVQHVMCRIVRQFAAYYRHFSLIPPRPPLAAACPELPYRHAHGHARAAVIAVRAIGEGAAPAKAQANEFAVNAAVDQMTGCCHLRPGGAIGQVAARIWRRRIELQRRER